MISHDLSNRVQCFAVRIGKVVLARIRVLPWNPLITNDQLTIPNFQWISEEPEMRPEGRWVDGSRG